MWINISRGIQVSPDWPSVQRHEPSVWCETVKEYLSFIERNFATKYLGGDFWDNVVKPTIKQYEEKGLE